MLALFADRVALFAERAASRGRVLGLRDRKAMDGMGTERDNNAKRIMRCSDLR